MTAGFSPDQRHVIRWAADECERQRSGEQSVAWMLDAWDWAVTTDHHPVTIERIQYLGSLIEPNRNDPARWRHQRVGIGDGTGHIKKFMPEPDVVGRLMDQLVAALPDYAEDPDEWYREFEEVHPFVDGNGRSGSILWNWLRGTLRHPEVPPDFWSSGV